MDKIRTESLPLTGNMEVIGDLNKHCFGEGWWGGLTLYCSEFNQESVEGGELELE